MLTHIDWGLVAGFAVAGAGIAAAVIARNLFRPLLTVRDEQTVPRSFSWEVGLVNVGKTMARVKSFQVITKGRPHPHQPGENPADYWQSVLSALGARRSGMGNDARLPTVPRVRAGTIEPIFHAMLVVPATCVAREITRGLRFEIVYAAPWGERFSLSYDFGRNLTTPPQPEVDQE